MSDETSKAVRNRKKKGLMLIKNLKNKQIFICQRFSKSSGDASPARHRAPPSPASLRGENADSQEELDVNSETGDGPVERKASTLPKATRKRFASEARKGWRGLLRKKEHPQQQQVKPSNGLSTESIGKQKHFLTFSILSAFC